MRFRAKECCGTAATAFVLYQGTEKGAFERARTTRRRNNYDVARILLSNSILFDDSQQQLKKVSSMYHRFSMVGDTSETAMQHPADRAGVEEKEPAARQTNLPSGGGGAFQNLMAVPEPLAGMVVTTKLPHHIAFVCDGNARWAQQRGLPVAAGHAAGADRLIQLIENDLAVVVIDDGEEEEGTNSSSSSGRIDYATFYAFSAENWQRSDDEIRHLFALMERTARSMMVLLTRQNNNKRQKRPIVVRFVGDIDDPRIPKSLRKALLELEEQSSHASSPAQQQQPHQRFIPPLTVSIAINYSARHDIVQAVRKIVAANEISLAAITQEDIRRHLSTRYIPDPDLIVRTSGENRLSNFLLWEAAYAEFYVTHVHWPDFDGTVLRQALQSYGQRQRRFGGRGDKVA